MNNRKLRKSVAFVASVCIVTASLGGCGDTSSYGTENDINNIISTGELEVSEEAEENNTESALPTESQPESEDNIREALDELAEAINNEDTDTLFSISFPNEVAKRFPKIVTLEAENKMDEAESAAYIVNMLKQGFGNNLEIISYTKEPIDDEYVDEYIKYLSFIATYDEGASLNEIDEQDIKPVYSIEESFILKVKMSNRQKCGILAYCVDGEGWKYDVILYPMMVGYIAKSKQNSADLAASSIKRAAEAAFTDYDAKGYKLPSGSMIISSDKKMNRNVPSDMSGIYNSIYDYFESAEDENWFICYKNGEIVYAVFDMNDKVGTYPSNAMFDGGTSDYVDKLEYFNEDEDKKYNYSFTYNDVYEACCKELGL